MTLTREDAIKRQVKGFIEPVFTRQLENGTRLNGLTAGGIAMIRAGYACGECLAMFDRYTVKCPVCGLTRDVAADLIDPPQLWLDHLSDRYNDDAPATPPIVPHKAIEAALSGDQMEETIPVHKLVPSKKKKARKT